MPDEPTPEQLDRVRRELAHLGTDEASAPEVPAAVTARVGAALRAAPPAHAVHAPRLRRIQILGAAAGVCAAGVAIGLGALMLARGSSPTTRSTDVTAEHITVSARNFPLTGPQIVALLSERPDYGPLADPQRRASCLSGLGYPVAGQLLGARPVDLRGRPAMLIVLPADTPKKVVALVVEPNCGAAGTELLASTEVTRP